MISMMMLGTPGHLVPGGTRGVRTARLRPGLTVFGTGLVGDTRHNAAFVVQYPDFHRSVAEHST